MQGSRCGLRLEGCQGHTPTMFEAEGLLGPVPACQPCYVQRTRLLRESGDPPPKRRTRRPPKRSALERALSQRAPK